MLTAGEAGLGAHRALELLTGAVSMANQFVVFIDHSDYDLGSWSKASGLSVRWDFCDYRIPSQPNYVWLSPGTPKYTPVKLSRAACSDSNTVQKWLANTTSAMSPHQPLSGAIQLIDMVGAPVVEWTLKEFFPIAWDIKEFDAGGNGVALETLELIHSGFLNSEARLPG
ncbi:MAG: phage tail protein [Jatrophihabitans sp.]